MKYFVTGWCVDMYLSYNFMIQCLSIVPGEIFRWILVGIAGFMSATFVAINLRAHIMTAGERWFLIVVGIFLLQLALSVVLRLYCFTVNVVKK